MTTLRSRIIRLAHARPDLRSHLLPLLKEAGPMESPLYGAGGSSGYALEVIRGMQLIDRGVKTRGTSPGGMRDMIEFNHGTVQGHVTVKPHGRNVLVQVYTYGRRPASIMFESPHGVDSVARSDVPRKIMDLLANKEAWAEE